MELLFLAIYKYGQGVLPVSYPMSTVNGAMSDGQNAISLER